MNSKVSPIYSKEVVQPVIARAIRSHDAVETITNLIIQIQEAAYVRGRSEIRCHVFKALFPTELVDAPAHNRRGVLV